MFPSALQRMAGETASVLLTDLEGVAPFMAARLRAWLSAAFGTAEVGDLFTRADAFPVMLFPWWLDASVRQPDLALHRDLTDSTISGYLYIRLVDNLMDGDAPADVGLLPALSFLHYRFTEPYHRRFAPGHPFWNDFVELWVETAEVTMRDHALDAIDRKTFERISARKTGAAKIPVAAVAHSLDRTDLLLDWYRLIDVFGCWHQMLNDVFGWQKDHRNGTVTYFSSTASRAVAPPEIAETWFVRDGFGWAISELDNWMDDLQELAVNMKSADLLRYLEVRRSLLSERVSKVVRGFEALEELGGLLRRQGQTGSARV